MKYVVAVFYAGLSKFKDETYNNHKQLFDRLSEHFNINVYDFTEFGRVECPFDPLDLDARGSLQVWDFASGLKLLQEQHVIRLRTDAWFTNESIDVIIKQLKDIFEEKIDASFVQFSVKEFRKHNLPYTINPVNGQGVGDVVIMANTAKILNFEKIFEINNAKKMYSGNWAFQNILAETSKANNVSARVYLVRRITNLPLTDEQVFLDFTEHSPKGL